MRFLIILLLAVNVCSAQAPSARTTAFVPVNPAIYVPGSYQGWAPSVAPEMQFDSATDIWVAYNVALDSVNQMKFTTAPDWSHINYGLTTQLTDTSGIAANDSGSAANIPVTVPVAGNYDILLTDSNNYYIVIPSFELGVGALAKAHMYAWPDPATDYVTISAGTSMQDMYITDMAGKKVMRQHLNAGMPHTIDVRQLPVGMYVMTLDGDTGSASVKLTVKR